MIPKEFSRDFSDKGFGEMVDFINTLFQNGLTLGDNLSGQIVEVSFSNNIPTQIPHRLKAVPKYRIILRQSGNAVIYTAGEWNDKFVTLESSGNVTATILLLRG